MIDIDSLNKFYSINKKTIFEKGLSWAKYILLAPNDPQRENIRNCLSSDPNIKKIIHRLNDPKLGISSHLRTPADFRVYGSFYWGLRFLADIGLSAEEWGIGKLIKQLQLQQLEDGQFMIRYHRKKQQIISLICMTAHLTYCLIHLGYRESNTVKAAVNYIVTTQRTDGGWHCDWSRQKGEKNESEPSCPAANIHVIRLLGQYGEKYGDLIQPAISQLINIYDFCSHPYCEFDSQQFIKLDKLRYPPHYSGLDILNFIHSMSFFPERVANSKLADLINNILKRWDGKNWLRADKRIPEWAEFDFSQKDRFSEWLTSLFIQAIEQVYLKN